MTVWLLGRLPYRSLLVYLDKHWSLPVFTRLPSSALDMSFLFGLCSLLTWAHAPTCHDGGSASVGLEGPDRCHDHGHLGHQPAVPALDVEELLHA